MKRPPRSTPLVLAALLGLSWPPAVLPAASEADPKGPAAAPMDPATAPPQDRAAPQDPGSAPVESDGTRSGAGAAERRYAEMIAKMRAAVEEIAELYGSPTFTQVFTNDSDQAAELRRRLDAAAAVDRIERDVDELQKRKEALGEDIALRQRECTRLAARLVRERAALDALGSALEQARKATEASTP